MDGESALLGALGVVILAVVALVACLAVRSDIANTCASAGRVVIDDKVIECRVLP